MDRSQTPRTAWCGTGRARIGPAESAVIIVIVVLAALLTVHGLPLGQTVGVLGGAGLLAVAFVRLATAGPMPSGARRWAASVLTPPATPPAAAPGPRL
ncbi:hypothetical protein ABT039_22735 [Streptomyces lasiicapitis]|uniref:hypothetical protein n=1 Tax=Streptomyces lasiicapitis TaxID=1923961 RepID=UPI00332D5964